MLLLWDLDGGLTQIDKYLLSPQENIKAGALMAIGIVNSQVSGSVRSLVLGIDTFYKTIMPCHYWFIVKSYDAMNIGYLVTMARLFEKYPFN